MTIYHFALYARSPAWYYLVLLEKQEESCSRIKLIVSEIIVICDKIKGRMKQVNKKTN